MKYCRNCEVSWIYESYVYCPYCGYMLKEVVWGRPGVEVAEDCVRLKPQALGRYENLVTTDAR